MWQGVLQNPRLKPAVPRKCSTTISSQLTDSWRLLACALSHAPLSLPYQNAGSSAVSAAARQLVTAPAWLFRRPGFVSTFKTQSGFLMHSSSGALNHLSD